MGASIPDHELVQARNRQNFSVAHSAGARLCDDRARYGRDVLIANVETNLNFWEIRSVVLATKIAMQPLLLPSIAHDFVDRASQHGFLCQRVQDCLDTKRLDERDDLRQSLDVLTQETGNGSATRWNPQG